MCERKRQSGNLSRALGVDVYSMLPPEVATGRMDEERATHLV